MDTAQWEEFGFWNVSNELSSQGYNGNSDELESKQLEQRVLKPNHSNNDESKPISSLDENELRTPNSNAIPFESPSLIPQYHERDPYRYNINQDNRGYMENEWNNNQWYSNPTFNYGGIELDMLLFQILDLVHQSECECIPTQCIFVPNQLSLERLFEMRTQLGVSYEAISFLEAYCETLKRGVEKQIKLNADVDGFCVKYLRDMHSRNDNNKPKYDKMLKQSEIISYENKERNPIYKSTSPSEEELCDDDNDSDYYDDGKMPKLIKESNQKKPNNEGSSNRLSKSAREFLRKWLEEHVDHPYPSDEEKKIFAERTNLSIKQINNWFINARRRELPKIYGKYKK